MYFEQAVGEPGLKQTDDKSYFYTSIRIECRGPHNFNCRCCVQTFFYFFSINFIVYFALLIVYLIVYLIMAKIAMWTHNLTGNYRPTFGGNVAPKCMTSH